jgi:hypothetical protein
MGISYQDAVVWGKGVCILNILRSDFICKKNQIDQIDCNVNLQSYIFKCIRISPLYD